MITKSTHEDIPSLLSLFAEARATIATLGIDQWQNGYPTDTVIREDILRGESYVYKRDGELLATFVLMDRSEPTYNVIYDGEWLTGQSAGYCAVHRVAIALRARGQGIATELLDFCARRALSCGKRSLRIDTHEGNLVMRRMLEKNGFCHCGSIRLSDGAWRVAYEKMLFP